MCRNVINISILLALIVSIFACKQEQERTIVQKPENQSDPLIHANKQAVKTEDEQITDLLKRYKWDMHETGSGLRYMHRKRGEGSAIKSGDQVMLNYHTRLINGDLVYSSEDDGPLEFIVGNAQVISGLEEGILLLHSGDKAVFVIPSHLAYGLSGDQNKIGMKATLIYEVEVINVVKN